MIHSVIRNVGKLHSKRTGGLCLSTMAVSSYSLENTQVSNTITLRKVASSKETAGSQRALVLLFPWLNAPPKAVDRYCELYHSRGMDVLTIKSHHMDFLWPNRAVSASVELLDYLLQSDVCSKNRPLLIHSFSVGAFLYSVVMMQMNKNKQKYQPISKLIQGQVFDSIVIGSLDHMITGILTGSKVNRAVALGIRGSLSAYFSLTKSYTVDFYDEAIACFKSNNLRGPILFYYCLDDPMCAPSAMEDLFSRWRTDGGRDIMYRCWEHSAHAGHMKTHSTDYLAMHNAFLRKTHLIDDDDDSSPLYVSKL